MKSDKQKNSESFRYILIVMTIASSLLLTGCYADKKTSPNVTDMIVVFDRDVPVEKASSILFEREYVFYSISENRTGKKSGMETGPVYTVKVPAEKTDEFIAKMKVIPQISDIYRADMNDLN